MVCKLPQSPSPRIIKRYRKGRQFKLLFYNQRKHMAWKEVCWKCTMCCKVLQQWWQRKVASSVKYSPIRGKYFLIFEETFSPCKLLPKFREITILPILVKNFLTYCFEKTLLLNKFPERIFISDIYKRKG